MRARDEHPRPSRRRPDARRRTRCSPSSSSEGLAAQLLHPRELYVGTLTGPQPALWRVALAGDRRSVLAPAPAGAEPGVVLLWAARQLLTAALRYDVSDAAVTALAAELPTITGADLELSDLEVRMWFLAWRLQHRSAS